MRNDDFGRTQQALKPLRIKGVTAQII